MFFEFEFRFINWSEIQTCQMIEKSINGSIQLQSDPISGCTQLVNGYRHRISGLSWWSNPNRVINVDGSSEKNQPNLILVTSSLDGNVRLWNPETKQRLGQLEVN